ncbi:MAG TPA: non-ribosomal peptide synthetase, partial [Caldithrix abyssi]|nr:non-ribosomal peptide synthetase [Caldithrix abyssi]
MTDKNQNEMAEQELYIFPTSFAQQRLWFLDQFEPGSPFYNIPTAVRIKGTLDIAALQDTIDEIVYRHESLRTTFDKENNEPVQVIHPDMECPLEIIDLRSLEKEEREAEGQRLALNEARTPFDLQKGPLFRSRLIRLQDDEAIMLVTMHHIISDGWSIGVFMREVALIYDAFTRDQDVPLPELPIQYADFSKWQRDWLQGEVLEKQLNYWKETLGPVTPVLELPTDKPRPAIQSSRGANFHHRIPRELYEQIIALSRREGVTPFMSLLAVFNILLYRYSGQEDICVGTPIANRTQSETEGLIGFFVNTLVLRTDLSGNPTFSELLQRTRKRTLESYAHQDVPFEMLVEVLQPERSMSHSPLFQVMFILQNATGGAMGADNTAAVSSIQMEQIEVDAGTATFDITVSLADQTRGLLASVEYCTDLFEQETIERFIRQYENLLAAVAAHPQSRISDLSVLSEQERHLILKEWNRSAVHYNWQRCMHHLVEEQVRRQPAAVAVAIDGAHITYEQLNRRANQLARHLRSLGVGAEVPVGISLEKSPDLMVAVLAVLKAGGGYVPMDPDYPPERLAYMIEDSATPVLITHGSLVERLPQSAAKFICLDREQETLEQYEADNPDVPLNPQNMAYMIYTSGTTGQAKGTVISHQSWVNSYYAWEEAYELKTRCRSHLQMANFSFDVFAGDTIRALCSGGKL